MKASRWSINPMSTGLVSIEYDVTEAGNKVCLTFCMKTAGRVSSRMRIQLSRAEARELAGRLVQPAINIVFKRSR